MKEVIVSPTKPAVSAEVRDAEIPTPQDDQLLIRVVVTSSNPKGK